MNILLLNSATLLIPCFLCVFFSWLLYRSNRTTPGIKCWSSGIAVFACVLLIYNWLHIIYLPFGILIANHLLIFGMLLQIVGTQQFFDRPVTKRPLMIIALLFSLIYCYFFYIQPDTNVRVVLFSLTYMISTSSILVLIRRYKGEYYRIAATSIYVAVSLGLVLMSYRIGVTLFADFFGGDTGKKLINQLISVTPFFICCAMLLAFFSLCNERQYIHIQQLKKRAQQQADNKQKLLAFLSHEFRTPLNAIVGKAQLLSRQLDSAAARYECELIAEAGLALSAINQHILRQAETEHTGVADQKAEVIEIAEWLKRLTDTYRLMAEAKGIKLLLQLSEDVPGYLRINKTLVQQVLTNLISNAIKYSDNGQIILSVSTTDEANHYKFSISDEGQGIPAHEQQKVLLPFGRAWQSLQQEGSGLGLALTQQLLHAMGSTLAFISNLGQGSCFYFSLYMPVAAPDIEIKWNASAAVTPKIIKNILVVEDVLLNQQVIAGMLAHIQHKSTMATTLSQAEEQLHSQLFDLILLDLNLPDGDGLEFFKRMKAEHPLMPETHILTANIAKITEQQCLATGVKSVLYKPVLLDDLQQLLAETDKTGLIFDKEQFWQLARYIPHSSLQLQLQQLDVDFADLLNQLKIGDSELQHQLFHKLAGKAATLGLMRLATTCHNFISGSFDIQKYWLHLQQLITASVAEVHNEIDHNKLAD